MSVQPWCRRVVQALPFVALAVLLSPASADATPCDAPTISWDGGAGTSAWTDAANWTDNRLPVSTDDVCIAAGSPARTITLASGTATVHSIEAADTLTISGGTLNVGGTSLVHNLNVTAGALGGTATVQVYGTLSWTGGAMNDAGTTLVPTSGTFSVSGSATMTLNATRVLDLRGTATMSGASTIYAYTSARIANSGTWTFSGSGGLFDLSGAGADPLFVNTGTIGKTGTSTVTIGMPFDNDGTVSATAGTLTLSAGDGGNTDTGTYDGSVLFSAGTFTLNGATLAGTISSSSSALVVNVAGTVTVPTGKALTLTGSSATLGGTGTLDVYGTLTWSGAATMSGAGTTLVEPGGDLQVSGNSTQTLSASRILDLRGTATVSTAATVYAYTSARIYNSGTLTFSGSGGVFDLSDAGADPLLASTGTVTKSGTSTVTLALPVDNDGTVTVSSTGPLVLSGGDGGNTGTGTFDGAVTFSAGTFTLSGATLSGPTISSSSAALVVNVADTATVPAGKTLTLSGGSATLGGAGTLHVAGTLTWNAAATMSGTGTTLVEPGGDLQVNGNSTQTLAANRVLDLRGTATVSTAATVYAYASTRISNSGTLAFTGSGGVFDLSGGVSRPLLANTGTVTKTGSSNVTIGAPFDNDGTVSATAGTLTLSGGDDGNTETGAYDGSVLFSAGTFTLNGATLAGTISSSGSALVVNVLGTVTVPLGRSLTLSGTAATLGGAGTLDVYGALNWNSAATMSGAGTTIVRPGGDLQVSSSSAQMLAANRVLDLRGTATVSSSASVYAYTSARIYNSGTLAFTGSGTFSDQSGTGADPLLVNTGTVTKSGTSTVTIGMPFDNDGTVSATAGTLTLSAGDGGNVDTGTYDGSVLFSAGTFTLNGATLSGPTISSSGSTLVVNLTGTVTVPTSKTLTLSGTATTLGGTGTLDVYGTLTWNGAATMSGSGTTIVEAGGDLQVSGSSAQTLAANRVLDLRGTATLSSSASIYAYTSARIYNSGTLALTGSGTFSDQSGTGADPLFVNTGTIGKTGTSTVTIGMPFDNDGTVSATAGTLTLSAGDGGNVDTGTYDGSVLFSAGTFTMNGATLAGTISSSSSNVLVNVTGTATVPAGKTLTLTGGAATIGGTGTLHVYGSLGWSGGATMSGTGTTLVQPGGDLQVSSSSAQILAAGRMLDLRGTATVSSASMIYAYASARIDNAGTLSFTGSGGVIDLSGGGSRPLLANTGALTKTGASTVTISVPIDNDGTLSASGGPLTLSGGDSGGAETGTFAGTVVFSAGTYTMNGATLGGSISSSSSNVVVNVVDTASVAAGNTLTLTGGAATLGGAGTLRVAGTLAWSGGATMDGTGTTETLAGGRIDVTGSSTVYLGEGRHVDNAGLVSWTGSAPISAADAVTLHSSGTWTMANDAAQLVDASTTTRPVFVNTGTLAKTTGFGTVNFGADLDNRGTVRVDQGAVWVMTRLVNYTATGAKLTGGRYVLTGALRFPAAAGVSTLAADVVLDGASGALTDLSGSNALAALTRLTTAGSLAVRNGAALTVTTAGVANSGAVTVGPAGSLTMWGTYSQSQGNTTLADAASTLTAYGTGVTLTGGTLEGPGTVAADLTNTSGTVSPGSAAAPGTLTVAGAYAQGPAGRLRLDVSSTANDRLDVSGTITYGGTLALATESGYMPATGATYTVLSYASASGSFDAVEGTVLGSGDVYFLTPGATQVTATVTSGSVVSYGSVSVDAGAASTNSTAVTLTLSVPSGASVTGVRVANDADPTGAYVAYTTSLPWTIAAGDGPHTVHVQFRDAFGNQSAVVTDSILLDTVAPVATITPPASATGFALVSFDEVVTGVATTNVVLRVNGTTTDLAATLTCKDGSGTVVACVTGAVRTVQLQPTGALLPFVTYAVVVDPAGRTPLTDTSGNAAATTTRTFTV